MAFAGITWLLVSGHALAQDNNPSADTQPPVIELEELADGVADSSQVFTVQIAEDNELQDATLYHRRSGEESFSAVAMKPLGDSDLYTVSVPTDPADLRAIEYYIQARDTAGNRTVSGFAFDPYSRTLAPAPVARAKPQPQPNPQPQPQPTVEPQQKPEPAPVATSTPFYKKRWFQVTLGLVAVGLAASTLDSDDDSGTTRTPVTFNIE